MKKLSRRKLTLAREVIKALDRRDLEVAIGGLSDEPSETCPTARCHGSHGTCGPIAN